jgi:crotonobetainyl-CoA:carnitine CoA-transferase CaiB-like acyl-CoA transferase
VSETPLEGIRVVECGSMIAGPVCARLLGDYGADVVKVEDPGAGDVGRVWGDYKLDGRSLWWPIQGRNKRCVTINLRTEAGQSLLRRLLERADIFVENFRPGTLERWGVGPDVLAELNPRLIVVRVSGFGQTGPARDKAGFGVVGEAIGGLRNVTGYPDQAPPRVGISLGDQLASIFGVVGALLALHARERTGRGQVVDVAIYEAVFSLMESLVTEHAKLGVLRQRMGPRLAGAAPSSIYPTSDGEWIIVAGNADNVFRRLAEAMGRPELADDPRYVTHLARAANADALDETISEWTRELTAAEVEAALEAAAVPCCKIYSEADIVADQHFWAREMLLRLQDGDLGELVIPGVVPKLSSTPGSVRWLAPGLGQHNDEVFAGDLGLSKEELVTLHADGIV